MVWRLGGDINRRDARRAASMDCKSPQCRVAVRCSLCAVPLLLLLLPLSLLFLGSYRRQLA